MIDLVRKLKDRYGLKVAVVSNEGRELTEYRVRRFELGKLADFFISLCFVHFRKPDADIYRIALDIAQVQPSQVIYIEDHPMFVEVAQTLGIDGIYHTGFESTRAALESVGLSLVAGIECLQDLNLGHHPLAKDSAVVEAWDKRIRFLVLTRIF